MARHLPRHDAGDRGGPAEAKCPADYKEIGRALSPIFSEDKKLAVLSGRACRERMNGLTSKYLEFFPEFIFSRKKTSTPC